MKYFGIYLTVALLSISGLSAMDAAKVKLSDAEVQAQLPILRRLDVDALDARFDEETIELIIGALGAKEAANEDSKRAPVLPGTAITRPAAPTRPANGAQIRLSDAQVQEQLEELQRLTAGEINTKFDKETADRIIAALAAKGERQLK